MSRIPCPRISPLTPHRHGFGFTSVDGPTIGTISGTVDDTTANVLVSINSDSYSQKTIYLRYRVYDSGDEYGLRSEWCTAMRWSSNLRGLTDAYYEIEASMGSDFMSCTVIKAIGTIGSPMGGPACHNDPHGTIHHCNNTYHYHYDHDQPPPPRPLQLTTTAAVVEASALAADNPRIRHRSSGTAPVNHAWSPKIAYREKW